MSRADALGVRAHTVCVPRGLSAERLATLLLERELHAADDGECSCCRRIATGSRGEIHGAVSIGSGLVITGR